MTTLQVLSRFARKPIREKWRAIKACSSSLWSSRQRVSHALARAKAEGIYFHSGLGDSANLLYGIARSMKPKVCVEIGSARGKSACYIALALKANGYGKLFAVDPHIRTDWNDDNSTDTYDVLHSNISALRLDEVVVVVRSDSEEVGRTWSQPIDLIFIDGDHSYQGVKRDWDLFVPHVRPFGVVVFHDTIWDLVDRSECSRGRLAQMGVPRFVDELRQQGYPVVTIDRDCGVSLVQPTLGGSPLRRDVTDKDINPRHACPASHYD